MRWRSTQPVEKSIPGTYKVGGRRVTKPTGLARDSYLGINKAPGKCLSCREAQTAVRNIGTAKGIRHRKSMNFALQSDPGMVKRQG